MRRNSHSIAPIFVENIGRFGKLKIIGLDQAFLNYSAGYIADHWCQKGHIIYCLEGEVTNELEGETASFLKEGMSYIVSDDMSSHRSITKNGVKLLIIDGDFLS